jgi:hypothetical protein
VARRSHYAPSVPPVWYVQPVPRPSDPMQADVEALLSDIATVEAALAPLTVEAHRLLRIVRTAGSPEAVAVARYDFRLVQRKRREFRAGLAKLSRERDGLVLEMLDHDVRLEAERDRADQQRDAEGAEVEA